MCEDYRATVSVDLDMDTADFKAGKKVTCPTMLIWGANGGVGRNHNAADVWSAYAMNIVHAFAVPSGHYVQEEAPEESYTELRNFFAN
jgi:haloacetate dehalogenase